MTMIPGFPGHDRDRLASLEALLTPADGGEVYEQGSGFKITLKAFAENRLALVGIGIVVFFVLFSFLGPHLYHSDQNSGDLLFNNLPPGKGHPSASVPSGWPLPGGRLLNSRSPEFWSEW